MPYAQTVNVGGASHNAMSKSVALIPHRRGVLLAVATSLSGWNPMASAGGVSLASVKQLWHSVRAKGNSFFLVITK